jgi:hypothetical protein
MFKPTVYFILNVIYIEWLLEAGRRYFCPAQACGQYLIPDIYMNSASQLAHSQPVQQIKG